MNKGIKKALIELTGLFLTTVVFIIPFYFVVITSFKNKTEASWMGIGLPSSLNIIENYKTVLTYQHGAVLRAFMNSTILTTLSIVILILVCSMAGFVLQRRRGSSSVWINFLVLAGLIVPPSIVPTFWVLKVLHIFKTIHGMALVEVALSFSFSTILYKGFMTTIPRELDEAAIVDGCGMFRMFFQVIYPLLKPVTSSIIVISAVTIFNDFVNPLYFLPGANNVTVQLTLYYFFGKYDSAWNLLFADVVLISLPPLVLFIFFNKQIIAGMTAGSVKA